MNMRILNQYPKDRVRALFGLEPLALSFLLEEALPVLMTRRVATQQSKPHRQRQVGGGRRRKLAPYQEVLLTLVYLRHNVSHAVVGQMFGVTADISENTFHEVVAVLREVCPSHRYDAQKKWTKTEPSWHPDTLDHILIDSFETPISRPSLPEAQRKVYSGKKKRHTLKTQIVTDANGEVLEIDPGHRGPIADKKLYDQSAAAKAYPRAARQADLGYLGIEGIVPNKKPRGGQLTPEQKAENSYHASVRVRVEHGVRRCKAWRILRDEYRLALGLFPQIALATVGLVHLARLIHA
jgi:hypothetical protein